MNPPALVAMTAERSAPVTLLSEISRLNHEIDGCQEALAMAERLSARGKAIPAREVEETRQRRDRAQRELDWLIQAALRERRSRLPSAWYPGGKGSTLIAGWPWGPKPNPSRK